jgi:hypothetical protein
MALQLILETGAGLSNANSYASLAEAESYHEGRSHVSAWTALTLTEKTVALVEATLLIDVYLDWDGSKATEAQALRWPRVGVVDRDGYAIDSTVIPLWLKQATAEQGRRLQESDRTAEPDLLEFSSLSVGPISLVKDQGSRKSVLHEVVIALLKPYGRITYGPRPSIATLVRV